MASFDAIVVGGGHNGLVCAGYLAGAGLKVAVVERAEMLGGPAGRREFMPGYFGIFPNSPGSLEPMITRDLELERHGLRFIPQNPTLVHPLEDGRLFVAWREKERTSAQLDAFAPGESARYDALFKYVQDFADKLGVSLFKPPPTLQELVRNLTSLADQEAFSRIFFGSVRDLFEEFELAPETKAVLGPISTIGAIAAPATPGTAMNLLIRPLSLASVAADAGYDPRRMPLRGSTGLPAGGMGAIVDSMASSALRRGVVLRTGSPVAHIRIRGGAVTGVVTASGEEIDAPIVVSAANPHITVLDLIGDEPEWRDFKARMARRRMSGKAYKLVLALDAMPRYAAAADDAEAAALAGAQFRIAPTLDYLEEAHTDLLIGRAPVKPVIWGLCTTITAPELAPKGKHILSMNIGNAPYELRDGDWRTERDKLARRCIEAASRWITNLPNIINDYRCYDPTQIEQELGLSEANITHGDMSPWNQFWMRPLPGLHDYRTPTRGLYLSGVGTWPGNYVSGIPGHNTAHAVLDDLRAGRIDTRQAAKAVAGARVMAGE
ncbi:MAG: NAD(P)/FAD-dependent oxidoreductase [Alphaproteobacteria bacterium]|nr:NAD(P)/FAD-dependent oxidoreductase [Alphaproteobacteria bacterium]